jgi:hypothetical protein
MNTTLLSSGIYFVRIDDKNGTSEVHKIWFP